MAEQQMPDFSDWSSAEIRRAETAAVLFLAENSFSIAETLEERLRLIGRVLDRLRSKEISVEERLLCLAMIQDLSLNLQESAKDFFEIGCHPHVASLLATVPKS